MRLIDADALLEHIKDIPTWWADEVGEYGHSRKYPDAMFYPEDIVSAVECAPTVEAGQWIDVKDALPEDQITVFVRIYGGTPRIAYHYSRWADSIGDGWYYFGDIIYGVTHWMPIPKLKEDLQNETN